VPQVTGKDIDTAGALLTAVGLRLPDPLDVVTVVDNAPIDGTHGFVVVRKVSDPPVSILDQFPAAGTIVPSGSAVSLKVTVPPDRDRFLVNTDDIPPQQRETDASATAYYQTVDQANARMTLDAWKSANGFGTVADVEANALYQNGADLGFGRHMHMRRQGRNVAFYVENFPSLADTIARTNLIATVTMEYSPNETGGNPTRPFTKFYVFDATGKRITSPALDSRGPKPQPGVCVVCHGGHANSTLVPDPAHPGMSRYANDGDLRSGFIPFDLDLLVFSNRTGFTRAEQEPEFKKMNEAVQATYARTFRYAGSPVAIPDNGTPVELPIAVTGEGAIRGLTVTMGEGSDSGITHPNVSDLTIELVTPSGNVVVPLIDRMPVPDPSVRTIGRISLASDERLGTGLARDPATGRLLFSLQRMKCAGGATCNVTVEIRRMEPATGIVDLVTSFTDAVPAADAQDLAPPTDVVVTASGAIYLMDGRGNLVRWTAAGGIERSVVNFPTYNAGLAQIYAGYTGLGLAVDEATNRFFTTDNASGFGGRVVQTKLGANGFQNDLEETALVGWLARFDADNLLVSEPGTGIELVALDGGSQLVVTNTSVGPLVATDGHDVLLEEPNGRGSVIVRRPVSDDSAPDVEVGASEDLKGMAADDKGFVYVLDGSLATAGAAIRRIGPRLAADIRHVTWDDGASLFLQDAPAAAQPFDGLWLPKEPLVASCAAEQANGTWKLRVRDAVPGGSGTIRGWQLHFGDDLGRAATHARALVDGWYGGAAHASAFDGSYVPATWSASPAAIDLYRAVVVHTCRLCHGQLEGIHDLSSYAQFLGLTAPTAHMVFDAATMPASERSFFNFWLSYPSQYRTLVGALNETARAPGKPIAITAPTVAIHPGEMVPLDGSNSLFAKTFAWSQIGGTGLVITASNTATARLTGPAPGAYTVVLEVSDGTLASSAAVQITSSSNKLSYAGTIATGYGSPANSSGWTFYGCTGCHKPGGSAGGVLDLQSSIAAGCFTNPADGACTKTLLGGGRVNRADPAASRLVRVPVGEADLSGGGKHFPVDAAAPSWLRGTVLKWIQDGAAP